MSTADPEVLVKPVEEREPHDSHDEEYESADEAYEEEEVDEIEIEEEEEEGAESKEDKDKSLDDDEDRKNPQFIPKKGYFYEHDDRTKTDEEEEEEPKKEEKKKVVPPTEGDRWSHDMFVENEQTPKSKEELSKAYGYDIWSEENAPRARRRRRYGRGPNKYTRHWEEEEAYQKPRGGFRGRGRGSRGRGNFRENNSREEDQGYEEEFPELGGGSRPTEAVPVPVPEKVEKSNEAKENFISRERPDNFRRHQAQHQKELRPDRQDYDRRNDQESDRGRGPPRGGRGGPGRGRGRRNEFTNRNRYANPNSTREEEDYDRGNAGFREEKGKERPADTRHIVKNEPSSVGSRREHRDRGPPTNGHLQEQSRSKDSPLPSKPPFTNTEYTGSASLTANRNRNNFSSKKAPEEGEGVRHITHTAPPPLMNSGNVHTEKPKDLREVINARRMQVQQQQQQQQQQHHQPQHHHQPQQQQQQNNQVIDRRSQIPPRLQQQNQQHQLNESAPKPKRFSTQRQRQVEQQVMTNQGPGGIPNSIGMPTSIPMSQGIPPNMIPVVTGAEQMISSPVPVYPQAPTYFDASQVYEATGSPVTVAAVVTNGSSVSPSLWASHAYTNAPYPSPSTGPQVPQPPYADHGAYIAAQQPGPIYSAPPQFIQESTLMNYPPPAPPYAPTYHPQTFQGYPQVAPPPHPEVYHGGVTYYSPQTQIQRQPMIVPQKRTKSVLQLVEPPEKARGKEGVQHPLEQMPMPPPHHGVTEQIINRPVSEVTDSEAKGDQGLSSKFERINLQELNDGSAEQKRKPSPLPEQESWSAQMEDVYSPTEESPTALESQEEVKSSETSPIRSIDTAPTEKVSEETSKKSDSEFPPPENLLETELETTLPSKAEELEEKSDGNVAET